jgi:serine/threonine-protein kinase
VTPERWKEVESVFQAALDRASAERAAFLGGACAGDADLRREVESLLAAHAEAGDGPSAAGDQPPALPPGARLGPYEIAGLLGRGGMGEVYRARDRRLEREVAIKVLPRHGEGDPERRRRLEREARAAGGIGHPNVLAIHDVGEAGGAAYVVSELLEGETLRERLRRARLTLDECLDWAGQAARGLAAAHDRGIVHRDLKPENLFLTRDGRLKILDFGLAKRSRAGEAAEGASTGTRPGLLLGTVGYMAPEQARGEPADERSDVFSIGAVLYEMATGRRAFPGPSPAEALAEILHREPPPLEAPFERLAPIVARCLEKRAAARFASARELASALAAAPGAGPRDAPVSIAVLPFDNLSAEPDQEYFCEGMAEELIAALTRVDGLRVAAVPPATPAPEHARMVRELGADKVVQGSVRRSGARLRVVVHVVQARDGYRVWSERFDREMHDVFAVQDEIAGRVTEALRGVIAAPSRPRRHVPALDAYHLYLRGRHTWNKRHQGGLQSAVRYFEQAIDGDPAYAEAYAGLADTYALLGLAVYGALRPREAMARAKAAAEKALALEGARAEAHAARAWVALHHDWDWARSESDFLTSLALDERRATTHHWHSFFLSARGRHDEALAAARRAFELDPLSPIVRSNLLQPPYYARRFEDAVRAGRDAVREDPDFGVHHYWLGLALAALGRFDEAAEALRAHARLTGRRSLAHVAYVRGRAGDRAAAEHARADLLERRVREYVPALELGLVSIGLGRNDEAFAWLHGAIEERSDQLAYLEVDPLFDPLRGDSRFGELLARRRPA